MQKVDYYKSLGLEKTATQNDIKQSYRKLALVIASPLRSIIRTKTKTKNRPNWYSPK